MKNKLLFAFAISFFNFLSYSQNNQSVVNSSTADETILTFSFNQYELKSVRTPKGNEQIVIAKNMSAIMQKATPDLPKYTESLIVSDTDKMKVEILSSQFMDFPNINMAPSKGNFSRTILPKDVPFEYGSTYSKNKFFPGILAQLDAPYIVRDYRGQALQVNPFQYNPITRVLRIYSEIKVRVYSDGETGENAFSRQAPLNTIDKDYSKIYKNHFKNFSTQNPNYSPLGEEGKMLIICHDAWMPQMESFVDWKNSMGRPTEMVAVSTAGGTAIAIRNYVKTYYNTKGLTYLLLVGDAVQVPTNSAGTISSIQIGGDSDNAYAYITGTDHYQEFFVGRFSAESPAQVTTQAQRTIDYEKGNLLASGWLNKVVSVASQEGPGDDNELDYQHLRNIQPDLLGFTYENPIFEIFEGSQGGFDQPGFPTATDVSFALNSGASIVNYVGHGSDISWGTSGFSNNNVDNLLNHNKLPFIFDVACVNGNFVGQTTFAESWMRSEDNNQPTGAIAICAATINQSWSPPMVGQDEMNDILVGSATTGIKQTFGGIVINGCFKMNDETSDFAMTDTWTCFGDPSLLVRTDDPAQMTVSHDNVVLVGTSNFQVNCSFNGGFATISSDGEIIGTADVIEGIASIPVAGLVPGQALALVITGFNQVSYVSQLTVISTTGSYLVVDTMENNSVDFGSTSNLNITLKNLGVENASNATALVTCADVNGSITNNSFNFGNIAANASSLLSTNAYTLTVANNVVDQHPIAIAFQMTDGSSQVWNEQKTIMVNAPKLTVQNMTIIDTAGNNNGILDPGETATLKIEVTNEGHAAITNSIGALLSVNPLLVINASTAAPYSLAINGNHLFEFSVTANALIVDGTPVQLNFEVTAGVANQYSKTKDFTMVVGFVANYCAAGANNTDDEFISNVTFASINNTSQRATSYTDFTSISTDLTRSQSYPISITNGEHFSGDQIGCWIDWNRDGDFTDADEYFALNYQNPIGTATIVVPANARQGNTRMRLRVMYDGAVMACGNASYGEVEDYTINVTANLLSENFDSTDFVVYPNPSNGNFVVKLADQSQADAIEVYTLNGQLILKQVEVSATNQIQLNVSKGFYLLKIQQNGNSIYKKLIVE